MTIAYIKYNLASWRVIRYYVSITAVSFFIILSCVKSCDTVHKQKHNNSCLMYDFSCLVFALNVFRGQTAGRAVYHLDSWFSIILLKQVWVEPYVALKPVYMIQY